MLKLRRYNFFFDIWLTVSFLRVSRKNILFDQRLWTFWCYFRRVFHMYRLHSCFISSSIFVWSICSVLSSAFKNDSQFLLLLLAQYVPHSSARRWLSINWTTLYRLLLRLVVLETVVASAQEVVKHRRILRVLYKALHKLIWAAHLTLHLQSLLDQICASAPPL